MKHWQVLRPGDVVDVVAPASHTTQDKLDHGSQWLESHGFIPRIPQGIIQGDVFFAAPFELQLEQFKSALASDSKAIWCVRGGYGSMRLIPHLMKMKPPKKPKLLLGFSDITALHLFFTQQWNWPTLHSRNISAMWMDSPKDDQKLLGRLLLGEEKTLTYKNLEPLNALAKKSSTIQGSITGGNLRIVLTSLKTPWEIKSKNKILFFEDVGERGYSVHRMLEQLKQAKLFQGVKAVVFGDFTDCDEKNGKDLVPEALRRFAQDAPYPVLKGVPAGHGEINYPVPFNTPVTLKTRTTGTLIMDAGHA